jgi:hypothetical protein
VLEEVAARTSGGFKFPVFGPSERNRNRKSLYEDPNIWENQRETLGKIYFEKIRHGCFCRKTWNYWWILREAMFHIVSLPEGNLLSKTVIDWLSSADSLGFKMLAHPSHAGEQFP